MKEYGLINKLEVGSWMSTIGADLKDDLLPHVTGGLRGRNLVVGSLEVKCSS